jgi:hypothetical protein
MNVNTSSTIRPKQYLGIENTINFESLIYYIHNRIDKLKTAYIDNEPKHFTKLNRKIVKKTQYTKETIIKTKSISSSFFKVSIEDVLKKLEEILAALNSYEKALKMAEIFLNQPLPWPDKLTWLGRDLLWYLKKQDLKQVELPLTEYDRSEHCKLINIYISLKSDISNGRQSEILYEQIRAIKERAQKLKNNHPILIRNIDKLLFLHDENKKFNEDITSSLIKDMHTYEDNNAKLNLETTVGSGQKEKNSFQITIGKGTSIVLGEGSDLKINGIPAVQLGRRILIAATNLIRMLNQESHCPELTLGLSAACEEIIFASFFEDDNFIIEKNELSRQKAAHLASNLTNTLLSPTGVEFLKKEAVAAYLLRPLLRYAQAGIPFTPENMEPIQIFVHENPLSDEEILFQKAFREELENIKNLLKHSRKIS